MNSCNLRHCQKQMLKSQKSQLAQFTLVTALTLALLGCGGGTQAEKPICPSVIDSATALAMINQIRAEPRMCGAKSMSAAPQLQWDHVLHAAATAHSKDMAQRNFFGHANPDGLTTSQRTTIAGYGPYTGENIGAGYASLETVQKGLLESAEHCENIMRREFKHYAVACASNDNSDYGTYWTQNFGSK